MSRSSEMAVSRDLDTSAIVPYVPETIFPDSLETVEDTNAPEFSDMGSRFRDGDALLWDRQMTMSNYSTRIVPSQRVSEPQLSGEGEYYSLMSDEWWGDDVPAMLMEPRLIKRPDDEWFLRKFAQIQLLKQMTDSEKQ